MSANKQVCALIENGVTNSYENRWKTDAVDVAYPNWSIYENSKLEGEWNSDMNLHVNDTAG